MFYCDDCRVKNDWPESFSKSMGNCEMCNEPAVCNDVPSRNLPAPTKPVLKACTINEKQWQIFKDLVEYLEEENVSDEVADDGDGCIDEWRSAKFQILIKDAKMMLSHLEESS